MRHYWGAGHLGGYLLNSDPTIFEALGVVRLVVELLVLMEDGGRGLPPSLASFKVLLAPSGGRERARERKGEGDQTGEKCFGKHFRRCYNISNS